MAYGQENHKLWWVMIAPLIQWDQAKPQIQFSPTPTSQSIAGFYEHEQDYSLALSFGW